MKRKILMCSSDAYHRLLVAMNKRTDEVQVRSSDLVEVTDCHKRAGARPPMSLIPENNRGKVYVDRERLYLFMNDHGEICGKGASENWIPERVLRQQRVAARAEALATKKKGKRK